MTTEEAIAYILEREKEILSRLEALERAEKTRIQLRQATRKKEREDEETALD